MKVPYFLLELGDTCIFQPQNIKPDNSDRIDLNNTIGRAKVSSSAHPANDLNTLWINGSDSWMTHRSLIVPNKSMKIFKQIIDNYNRSLDV